MINSVGDFGCRRGRFGFASGPDFLAHDRRIVPREAQLGVRSKAAQDPQRVSPTRVVEQKQVSLFALDKCQHVNVFRHKSPFCPEVADRSRSFSDGNPRKNSVCHAENLVRRRAICTSRLGKPHGTTPVRWVIGKTSRNQYLSRCQHWMFFRNAVEVPIFVTSRTTIRYLPEGLHPPIARAFFAALLGKRPGY
jgi:hypothetical protein